MENIMIRYLIFDFDGVLGDTLKSWNEVIKEVEGLSDEELVVRNNKVFTKSTHTRDFNFSEKELEVMNKSVSHRGSLVAKKGFDLFDGFMEEIKKIPDTKMAVVSSGSFHYIKPELVNCGLEFSHILTFEDHHSKEEKVENICKDWAISLDQAYFFTDSISDVVELERILDKNKIYGCSWGYQGHEKLATVLDKEHIFDKFSDIQKIFKK